MVGSRESAEGSDGAQFARKEWFPPSTSSSISQPPSFQRTWRNPWTYTCMWDALGRRGFQILRNEWVLWVTPFPHPGGKCKSADPRTRKPSNALDLKISEKFMIPINLVMVDFERPLWNPYVLDFYESQSLKIPSWSLKTSDSISLNPIFDSKIWGVTIPRLG